MGKDAMATYRIREWDEKFENYKSRERDNCSFLCVPTKRGLGLARVLTEPDGLAIFGLFILVAEDCMRQRRGCLFDTQNEDGSTRTVPRRDGWMTDDGKPTGRPWTASDIAISHRCKESQVIRMIEVMTSEAVGWIEQSNAVIPSVPAKYPESTPICKVSKEGKEVSKEVPTSAIAESGETDSKPKEQKPSKERKKPTGPHAEAIEHFCATWKAKYGTDYLFAGGKDGTAIKRILDFMAGDIERFKRGVSKYIASGDDFISRDRHGIGLFQSQLRKFDIATAPNHNHVFREDR